MLNLVIKKKDYALLDSPEKELGDIYRFMYDYYKKYYPGFRDWYFNKLVPGFHAGNRIIYTIQDVSASNYYGIAILKKSISANRANKICSFFLLSEAKNNGLGSSLMSALIDDLYLCYSNPNLIITVPEERLFESYREKNFNSFLGSFGFEITKLCRSKYRVGRIEYVLKKILSEVTYENRWSNVNTPQIRIRRYFRNKAY